jgi:hypothetical protein
VKPLAPTVSWAPAPAAGVEGSALGAISATVNSLAGDTNSLASLVVSAIPVGAILSDGTNTFTAKSGSTAVDVRSWNLSKLTMSPANDANFTRVLDALWGQRAKVRAPCPRVLYSVFRAPDPSSRARPKQRCPKKEARGKLTSPRQSH